MIEWTLVPVSFLGVFLKAFQQKNVMQNKYLAVPLVTYGLAFTDVFIIGAVAYTGITWASVNGIAIGGATGCIAAMLLHNKIFKQEKP